MNSKILMVYGLQRKSFVFFAFILLLCAIILGCTSTKNLNEETTILGTDQKSEQSIGSDGTTTSTFIENFGLDDHFGIWIKPEVITPPKSDLSDSLTQTVKIYGENEISSQDILGDGIRTPDYLEIKSAVADKIVNNYE